VVARELTDLPVIVDPSHAAGRSDWVPALARAALAVGADGLLVEAHPAPAQAWSDAAQTIDIEALAGLVADVRRWALDKPA
jgi:3-deoxy-7-phosphoheptulonate synthase